MNTILFFLDYFYLYIWAKIVIIPCSRNTGLFCWRMKQVSVLLIYHLWYIVYQLLIYGKWRGSRMFIQNGKVVIFPSGTTHVNNWCNNLILIHMLYNKVCLYFVISETKAAKLQGKTALANIPPQILVSFLLACGRCYLKFFRSHSEINPRSQKSGILTCQTFKVWCNITCNCWDPGAHMLGCGLLGVRELPMLWTFQPSIKLQYGFKCPQVGGHIQIKVQYKPGTIFHILHLPFLWLVCHFTIYCTINMFIVW